MVANSQPWTSSWTFVRKLSAGGQGKTSIVRKKGSDPQIHYVLKELIDLKGRRQLKARKRFHREVTALETLTHTSIPKLLESNSAEYAAKDISLFLVEDLAPGEPLHRLGAQPFAAAAMIIARVVDCLEYCHTETVLHRDIKPANVMWCADTQKLSVLDFGLSHMADSSDEELTDNEEQIGNRFLSLPEFATPGSPNDDARSDIASTVGLLYYLLTRLQPKTLRDERGRKPHERKQYLSLTSNFNLDEVQSLALADLFAVGFEPNIAHRFQNFDDLRARVSAVGNPIRSDENLAERLKVLARKRQDDQGYRLRKKVQQLEVEVTTTVGRVMHEIATRLESEVSGDGKGFWFKLDGTNKTVAADCIFQVQDGQFSLSLTQNSVRMPTGEYWRSYIEAPRLAELANKLRSDIVAGVEKSYSERPDERRDDNPWQATLDPMIAEDVPKPSATKLRLTSGLCSVYLEDARQEIIDEVYKSLCQEGEWPQALSLAVRLLQSQKIELRSSMLDAGWLFPVEDIGEFHGSVSLTLAGLCLVRHSNARGDTTWLLRFIRALGRRSQASHRQPVTGDTIFAEMGEKQLVPYRLLLVESVLERLGFTVARSQSPVPWWAVLWDDQLMSLAYVSTADELLEKSLGTGLAEYQRRSFPQTMAPTQLLTASDKRLLAKFEAQLPFEGSIRFIKETGISGGSFDYSELGDLTTFYREWVDAAHCFVHPCLERARHDLHSLTSQFLDYVALWTWVTSHGRQSIPLEWEIDDPMRWRQVIDELDRMADEIVHIHQELTTIGRHLTDQ